MTVTISMIIEVSALIAAIAAIWAIVYKCIKWIQEQNKQSADIEKINQEMVILVYSMYACLDGLHQLHCNGKVTDAHNKLEAYLIHSSHGQENKKK